MPLNIIIALAALLAAVVLYSIGAWGMFRAKTARLGHVATLWLGFVFDVLATGGMAWQVAGGGGFGLDLTPGAPMVHTLLAFVGMFGMLAAAVVATVGYIRHDEGITYWVSRWVLAPWLVWVAVFVWGMIDRGSARMGA